MYGLELSLTPGIAVAEAVIREIDVNGDAVLSGPEQHLYAGRVLRAVSLRVDDTSRDWRRWWLSLGLPT